MLEIQTRPEKEAANRYDRGPGGPGESTQRRVRLAGNSRPDDRMEWSGRSPLSDTRSRREVNLKLFPSNLKKVQKK